MLMLGCLCGCYGTSQHVESKCSRDITFVVNVIKEHYNGHNCVHIRQGQLHIENVVLL